MRSITLALGACAAFWSANVAAAITVNITKPAANAAIGDSLSVSATIASPFQLASVQAQIGTVTAPLTTSLSTTGTLDISGVPTGPTTLMVTATDTQGNSGSGSVVFAHDHPPTVAVTAPLPGTVARPSLRVTAACSDGDAYGCQSIAVRLGSATGTVLATANASTIDQTLSLDAYAGTQISLYLVVSDAAGLTAASPAIPVYVDTSPRLVEVQSVPAPIVDVDATRILYGTTIRTRGTNDDVMLPAELGNNCRLSPEGALCNAGEWKNGTEVATWPIATSGLYGFVARGRFAAWVQAPNASPAGFYHDSNAGTTVQVVPPAGTPVYAEDVADNGDAVFIQQIASIDAWPVYRYRDGTLTALTSTTTNAKYMTARTDGINVIFQRYYIGYYGGLDLYTSAGMMIPLVPENTPCASLGLVLSYAVRNGWTAYTSPDSTCQTQQTWVRAPDDTRTQISVWSTSSTVDAINDAGQVMMLNTSSLGANRYLASPGIFPETISSTLGRAIWLDNQWYVVMGRTLFSIGPVPPPADAGSGPTDASVAPPLQDASVPVEPADMGVPVLPDDASVPVIPGGSNDTAHGAASDHAGGCAMTAGAPAPGGAVVLLILLFVCRKLAFIAPYKRPTPVRREPNSDRPSQVTM